MNYLVPKDKDFLFLGLCYLVVWCPKKYVNLLLGNFVCSDDPFADKHEY